MDRESVLSAHLESLKQRYESGESEALLDAIDFCGKYKLVMPDWVSWHFSACYKKWADLDVKTLDEAFDMKRPKNFRLGKEKERIEKATNVFLDVLELSSLNQENMEKVAKKHGINRDKVWTMYKQVKGTEIGKGMFNLRSNSENLRKLSELKKGRKPS